MGVFLSKDMPVLAELDMREEFNASFLASFFSCSVLNYGIYALIKALKQVLTKRGVRISPQNHRLMPLYVISLAHALMTSGFALRVLKGTVSDPKRSTYNVIAASLGYFVHDLVVMLRNFGSQPLDCFHHILAFIIYNAALRVDSGIIERNAKLLICEASTVFFDIYWIFKVLRVPKTTALRSVLRSAFVLAFFLTRVVYFATHMGPQLYSKDIRHIVGKWRHTFIPIYGLQLFWFSKMVRSALRQ